MRYLVLFVLLAGCADNTSSFNRTYPKRPEIITALANLSVIVPKCHIEGSANVVFDNDVGTKLKDNVLGHCVRTEVTKIHDVVLNRINYDQYKYTKYYIEMLVLHEIGHCQYKLDHTPGTIVDAYANYMSASDQAKIDLMKQFEDRYCK